MYRRRRAVRPGSRILLVAITWLIALVVWAGWELGRSLARLSWWRAVAAVTSGLTFVLFAVGDYLQ